MNCPVCGIEVEVSQSDEGTGCYLPSKDFISRKAVVEMLEGIETIVSSGYMGMCQALKHPEDMKTETIKKIQSMPNAGGAEG